MFENNILNLQMCKHIYDKNLKYFKVRSINKSEEEDERMKLENEINKIMVLLKERVHF